MKAKQKNKLNMYKAVFSVMNDHKEIWTGVFQLKSVFKKFSENLSRLTAFKTDQEMDLQPLLDAVFEKRDSLFVTVNPVVNILLAYANDIQKKELIKKIKLSKKELIKSNDLDLIENSKIIYKTAKKLLKKSVSEKEKPDNKSVSIIDYGLNEKMIIDLKVATKEFAGTLLALHEGIQNKDLMDREISSILKKNDKMLKNKLDLLITIFETSKPDFYKSYMEARVIHKPEIVKIKKTKGKKDEKEELHENDENPEN
jgi:hypothetical protein